MKRKEVSCGCSVVQSTIAGDLAVDSGTKLLLSALCVAIAEDLEVICQAVPWQDLPQAALQELKMSACGQVCSETNGEHTQPAHQAVTARQ